MKYLKENKQGSARTTLSFIKYLCYIGFTDPSVSVIGMDDRVLAQLGVNTNQQKQLSPTQSVARCILRSVRS